MHEEHKEKQKSQTQRKVFFKKNNGVGKKDKDVVKHKSQTGGLKKFFGIQKPDNEQFQLADHDDVNAVADTTSIDNKSNAETKTVSSNLSSFAYQKNPFKIKNTNNNSQHSIPDISQEENTEVKEMITGKKRNFD